MVQLVSMKDTKKIWSFLQKYICLIEINNKILRFGEQEGDKYYRKLILRNVRVFSRFRINFKFEEKVKFRRMGINSNEIHGLSTTDKYSKIFNKLYKV